VRPFDHDFVSVDQRTRCGGHGDHRWQRVLSRDDGGVREDGAAVGNEGAGALEDHHPGGARRAESQEEACTELLVAAQAGAGRRDARERSLMVFATFYLRFLKRQ